MVGWTEQPPERLGPDQVKVYLTFYANYEKDGVTLTAGAANGIVAVNDGAAWAEVTALELPFT